ncbi:MAG: fatty acid desaturase [Candidatus Eisenbacteria bacterium]
MSLPPEFTLSRDPEPHRERRRQILASHPEVRALAGPVRSSALFIVGLVVLQFAAAWAVRQAPWWVLLLSAYVVGAVVSHALFVLIHECTHNLVWKGTRANRFLAILANAPIVFPAAMSFRKMHLLHHKYQGDFDYDADLPGTTEARLVGHSPIRKALWMLFFLVFEALRPVRMKKVKLMDLWTVTNVVAMVAVATAVVRFAGWEALGYLLLSTFFGVGLHPVGARWIQEHFVIREGQETNSYYGPWNRLAFNVGYHNEHHDLMTVAWSRLPRLRAIAPEFYDGLYSHRSWTRLALRFIFDPSLSLHSRVVRAGLAPPLDLPDVVPAKAVATEPSTSSMG